MYERLLASGRPPPLPTEGVDSVTVTRELCRHLEVADTEALRPWLGRLMVLGLVHTVGRTQGQRYFVAPALLRAARVNTATTLARIEPHRLRALILEDLARYPESASPEIHARVGAELSVKTIKRALDDLVAAGAVSFTGERRWRRYRHAKGQSPSQSSPAAR